MNLCMRNTYSRSNRGFSLIELLIVVAIIMILAAIAIPSISPALMLSRETAAMRQVGTIQTAETQYYSQFEKFAGQLSENSVRRPMDIRDQMVQISFPPSSPLVGDRVLFSKSKSLPLGLSLPLVLRFITVQAAALSIRMRPA